MVKKKKIIVIVIFFLLGFGILMQHLMVGMYFDDFGNASLSYGYDPSLIVGTEYTLKDMFAWAKNTYFNWSGRVLYALMMIPMMKYSIQPFMIFQSIVLLLIFAVMYKIVKRYCGFDEEPLVLIGFVIMYGLLTGAILTWGIYWASASVLYLLPILPFLLCIDVYENVKVKMDEGKKIEWQTYVQIGILIPLITLSQEQIGGAFLVWIVCRIVLGFIKKEAKTYKLDLFVLVWGLITFLIFFLAPGNWVRLDSNLEFASLSLFEKINHNLPFLTFVLAGDELFGINILLWSSGILMLLMINKKYQKSCLLLLLGIVPFGICLLNKFLGRAVGIKVLSLQFCTISYILFLVSMFVIMIMFFMEKNQMEFLAIMIAAVASVFCLLLSPSIALRSCIPYTFICMLFIEIIIYSFLQSGSKKVFKSIIFIEICMMTLISICNLRTIYIGYRENLYAEKYNWKMLKGYNGRDNEIKLVKYSNDIYRGPACYDSGFEFCEVWVKEYFDIPWEVVFVWEEQER